VVAEPTTYQGSKGTYTIDLSAGTYRGCLDSGGCISLGRKYLIKNTNPEFTGIRWKNGQYVYEINEGALNVSQNGRIIFQDRVSTRSSEVGEVDRPRPFKAQKANKNTKCSTLTACNRAIEIDPRNAYAYLSRAGFFEDKNQFKDALADYNQAVEVDPQNPDIYLSRAKFKKGHFGEFSDTDVLNDYNKAIEVEPQNSDLYLIRGKNFYQYQYGSSEDELADYNTAIKFNPQNSSAYLSRAKFKERKNDLQGALADCNLSLRYANTSTDISSAKECIRGVDNR
jgi:tetratricopeptide (TPR) repeat protein